MAAATIRSFSARDQRRRRCTDVINSTCDLVLGLAPGLDQEPHLDKAAITGRLRSFLGLTAIGDTTGASSGDRSPRLDSAQVVYNMLNPSAASELPILPCGRRRGDRHPRPRRR